MNRREAILTVGLVASYLGLMVANIMLKQQDENYTKLLKKAKLNHKIIEKFVEYSDPFVSTKIMHEFEFDSIVIDLE